MRSRSPVLYLLLGLVAGFVASTAQANIYSFTDKNGVAHFTNVPTDPRYRLLYRSTPHGLDRPRTPRPPSVSIVSRNQKRYRALVDAIADQQHIDKALLHAVIAVESGYNAKAVSPKGAIGLMQVMPATGLRYGVKDLFDPRQNIRCGASYLADLLQRFRDVRLALAAYNAGEDAIAKYGNRIPPYEETMFYIPRVMRLYKQYRQGM